MTFKNEFIFSLISVVYNYCIHNYVQVSTCFTKLNQRHCFNFNKCKVYYLLLSINNIPRVHINFRYLVCLYSNTYGGSRNRHNDACFRALVLQTLQTHYSEIGTHLYVEQDNEQIFIIFTYKLIVALSELHLPTNIIK